MPTPITTHVVEALARLPAQFVDKPVIKAFLSNFVGRTQRVENVLNAILELRFFDTAQVRVLPDTNPQFDLLGQYVGQKRAPGESDAVYKAKIGVKMLVNRSHGQPDELLEIVRLYCEIFGVVIARVNLEHPPLAFSMDVTTDPGFVPGDAQSTGLKAFLNAARSATVLMELVFASAHPFGFDEDPTAFGFDDGELAWEA